MTLKEPLLLLACLFVVLPIALATCPSKEDVAPCTCQEYPGSAFIHCSKIGDKELVKVARSLRGMSFNSFIIEECQLGVIPHDIFKGVQVNKLFIQGSNLSALTDTSEAFVGLEDSLKEFSIFKCAFKNRWNWSVLRNLKKLNDLTIEDSLRLEALGTDIMKVSISSSVEKFFSSGNNIIYVYDRAFESFKNLRSLTLANNKNKNLKRTMLPNPALKFVYLSMTKTLIEQIPGDMFTNMPNLRVIDFSSNNILVLNERTFSPVWEQLRRFSISGNPLRCDCSMSWLPKKKRLNALEGECASPPKLKGKELATLTSKDFVC